MENIYDFEIIKKKIKNISSNTLDDLVTKTKNKELGIYWGSHINISYEELEKRINILNTLQKKGFRCILLLADLHTFLKYKEPWGHISKKVKEIKKMCRDICISLNSEINIVKGSDFQFNSEYFFELYHFMTKMTTGDMHNIMKTYKLDFKDSPINIYEHKLSNLIYPMMQFIDQEQLSCDIQIGSKDQIELFTFYNNKLNYPPYGRKEFLIFND